MCWATLYPKWDSSGPSLTTGTLVSKLKALITVTTTSNATIGRNAECFFGNITSDTHEAPKHSGDLALWMRVTKYPKMLYLAQVKVRYLELKEEVNADRNRKVSGWSSFRPPAGVRLAGIPR